MTNAPIPRRYGRISAFCTAISFLTGLKMYQEHKTKKKKKPASKDSFVKDIANLFKTLEIGLRIDLIMINQDLDQAN